jgi:hypothetical protein
MFLFYVVLLIISAPFDGELISFIMIFLISGIFLLISLAIIIVRKEVILYDDRIETRYFFRLFKFSNCYDAVKMTYIYNRYGEMISLETDGWLDIRIGQGNYKNFEELKEALESKIKNTRHD